MSEHAPYEGDDAAAVPLIAVEGTALECGRQYAELMAQRYPDEREYLDRALVWDDLDAPTRRLVEARAPWLLDLYQGLNETAGAARADRDAPAEGCTSFGVAGAVTRDGHPLAGQTKDTGPQSRDRYIVLRMRIRDAPTILVLAYPGEVLGYGIWSTGMSLFRNSLHSSGGGEKGLTMVQWGLLALAGRRCEEAVELARQFGLIGSGNFLITDGNGVSCSVEFNAGGVDVIDATDGIATHANHPEGRSTGPYERYPIDVLREDSRYRQSRLRELLAAQRGRVTPESVIPMLADHARHPLGLCRHPVDDLPLRQTTAGVVAETARGRLHVTRGNPCENRAFVYST